MMLAGFADGGLELRKKSNGSVTLRGRFPYNSTAVLSDGGRTGRPKKEKFASRAFAYRVDDPDAQIHILVGHDYGKPLASRSAGTLDLTDADDALSFDATIAPELQNVTYVRDFLAGLGAGLIGGISPAFRLPPKRRVAKPETIENEGTNPEAGEFNAIIRTIHEALLFEISVVTSPAYDNTQIEARNWNPYVGSSPLPNTHNRWRL